MIGVADMPHDSRTAIKKKKKTDNDSIRFRGITILFDMVRM